MVRVLLDTNTSIKERPNTMPGFAVTFSRSVN